MITRNTPFLSSGTTRNGLILLTVMLTMTAFMVVVGLWLRTAQALQVEAITTTIQRQVVPIKTSAEQLIIQWIKAHGDQAVAPPAGGGWTIVRDHIHLSTATYVLQITLFDGWAGYPAPLIGKNGPMRNYLPPLFTGLDFPSVTYQDESEALSAHPYIELITLNNSLLRYPNASIHAGRISNWEMNNKAITDGSQRISDSEVPTPALSLMVSPHSDGRININTAPVALIEKACRMRGIGMPAELYRNREAGRHTSVMIGNEPQPHLPSLVDKTMCWNALIHIQSGNQSWAWWVVVTSNRTALHIIQRHAAQ